MYLCYNQVWLQSFSLYRCDEFINLCEIHGRIKFTEPKANGTNNCCGEYFDPTPFFSEAGTCFTTKNRVSVFYV